MLYDVEAKSNEAVFQRLRVLDSISRGEFKFIVTSIEALSHKLIEPQLMMGSTLKIDFDSKIELEGLIKKLVIMAYERVESVEKRGQFSVRGGIVDVYSVDSDSAVRLELFGDEIDSMRQFDVNTQRS